MAKEGKLGKGLGRGLESLFVINTTDVEVSKSDLILNISID